MSSPKKKSTINYIITKEGITFTLGDKVKTVFKDHDFYDGCLSLIKTKNLSSLSSLIFPVKLVAKKYSEFVSEKDGKFYIKGEKTPVPKAIGIKLMEFARENQAIQPLINFWERLKKNPSSDSREELFSFLERHHHPLTEDGCFIGYKKVDVLKNSNDKNSSMTQSEVNRLIETGEIYTHKWVDNYTKTFDNSKGKTVQMERGSVDPNRRTECSNGLHVGCYSYSSTFSGTLLLEVIVDPADVVSVPEYSGFTKMRVCKYISKGIYGDNREIKASVVKTQTSKPQPQKKVTGNKTLKTKEQLSEMKAREIFEYSKKLGMGLVETPSLLKGKSSLIAKILKFQNSPTK